MLKNITLQLSNASFNPIETKACEIFDCYVDSEMLPLCKNPLFEKLGKDNFRQLFRILMMSAPVRSATLKRIDKLLTEDIVIANGVNLANGVYHLMDKIDQHLTWLDIKDRCSIERIIECLKNCYQYKLPLLYSQVCIHSFAYKVGGINVVANSNNQLLETYDYMFENMPKGTIRRHDIMFFGNNYQQITITSFTDIIKVFEPIDDHLTDTRFISEEPNASIRFGFRFDGTNLFAPQYILKNSTDKGEFVDYVYTLCLLITIIKHVDEFSWSSSAEGTKHAFGYEKTVMDYDYVTKLTMSAKPVMGNRVLFSLEDGDGLVVHFNLVAFDKDHTDFHPVITADQEYLTTEDVESMKDDIQRFVNTTIQPLWKVYFKSGNKASVSKHLSDTMKQHNVYVGNIHDKFKELIKNKYPNEEFVVSMSFDFAKDLV